MDEEKKIMEKRSSFRGWKERNKGKIHQKRNAIGIVIIASIFMAMITYPYWNKIGDNNPSAKQPNETLSPTITKQPNKTLSPTPIKNIKINSSNSSNGSSLKNIIGNIGTPLIINGSEITVKSITKTSLYISIWISVKNIGNDEKPFKLGPGTIVIDDMGQQYENIKVARSAEIAQTNLYAQSMREGAVFFERLKEGRNLKKLVLNINGEKIEFILK